MGNTLFFQWEVDLMIWLQTTMGAFGKTLAVIFTLLGDQLIVCAILIIIYLGINKKAGKTLLVSIVTVLLICPLFKNIVCRRRPYFDHDGIKCLRPVESKFDVTDVLGQGFSFPSMHSAASLTLYGTLALFVRRNFMTIIAVLMPLMIGLSRIMLGVHYPTDILAGWLIGLFGTFVMTKLQEKFPNRRVIYLIVILLGLCGWFYCTSTDFFTLFGLAVGIFGGFLFEEQFVNFEDTHNMLQRVIRIVGAMAIFLIVTEGTKFLIPADLADNGSFISHILRCLRYALGSFLCTGPYTLLFKKISKLGKH